MNQPVEKVGSKLQWMSNLLKKMALKIDKWP
jgi:hypothetical protein